MILEETYKYAFKYYELHNDLSSNQRIININTIFGISRASFFRVYKKYINGEILKKTTLKLEANTLKMS